MTTQVIVFNDPPGSFIVKALDGSDVFDSRRATQLIYMRGTTDLASTSSVATTKSVPYGKTFLKTPYIRSAARIIAPASYAGYDQAKGFYSPAVGWSENVTGGATFYSGNFTSAFKSEFYVGNAWPSTVTLRFVYTAFENPVE